MESYSEKAIDLFCGVGGLSLGAARAGVRIVAGIEFDERAIRAHKKNFPCTTHIQADITAFCGDQLSQYLGSNSTEIGIVMGGPPCQGFSRIGKRDPNDPRNSLIYHFCRIVSEVKPRLFLFENVPGILDSQFDNLRKSAFDLLGDYTILEPLILKASDFGAATSRERVFFIGYNPQCFHTIRSEDFDAGKNINVTNVTKALRGLNSRVDSSWQTEEHGWRKLTGTFSDWFGKKMMDDIPNGVGDPDAVTKLNDSLIVSGSLGTLHTKAVKKRFEKLKEGSIDKPSRALRLKRTGLCPTLRAGTGNEYGSFQALRPIHPTQHRVITPREAARLQGFPDWFQFDSTKWHSFRQIGNSVSPLLAEAIFRVILSKKK